MFRPAVPDPADDELLPLASRQHAGALLARRLMRHRGTDALVLGLPCGGITVAARVAAALQAELDVLSVRLIELPDWRGVPLGAFTADGTRVLDPAAIAFARVGRDEVERLARAAAAARRRETVLRGASAPPSVLGRTVILVDDGMTSAVALQAAAVAIRRRRPALLVAAVPLGSADACAQLRGYVDELVCLAQPEPLYSVALHYWSYPPVTERDVSAALREVRAG